MLPTTFAFLIFGQNLKAHTMANFAILSLQKYIPTNSQIVVYTDKPEHYNFLSPIVKTRLLSQQLITEWQGKYSFVWRTKLLALLDSTAKDSGHLVYVDADTFTLKKLDNLIEKLEKNYCFMHLKESLLSEDKAQNKRIMWQQTKDKIFGGMLVDKNTAMWNAGIVAFSALSKVELLNKALLSTDEMCEQNVEQWLIEQLSLSQALAMTEKLLPAEEWFAHYWGFKEKMLSHIQAFHSLILQKNLSIEEAINLFDVKEWNKLLVPESRKSFIERFKFFSR